MKGTKNSPWAYGVGKPLTQSIGSSSNAQVLENYLGDLFAAPEVVGKPDYPKSFVQDALGPASRPTRQAVISDMLPAVIEQPKQYVPPKRHPSVAFPDEYISKGHKPNFFMGNAPDRQPVVVNSGNVSSQAGPAKLEPKYGKRHLLKNLAKEYTNSIDDINYFNGPEYSPWAKPTPAQTIDIPTPSGNQHIKANPAPFTQTADDIAMVAAKNSANSLPSKALDAGAKGLNVASKVLNPSSLLVGAKAGLGIAGLPGVTDILMPEYANAGTDGMDWRNEMAKKEQHKVANDADLLAMLGVESPENYIEAPILNDGRSLASNSNLPSRPQASQAAPDNSGQSPAINSSSQHLASNRGSFSGSVNDQPQSDEDAFRDLVNRQQMALQAKQAGVSNLSATDLSPLMAWVDTATGSNLARSYKHNDSTAQDFATSNALGKQLADHENKKKANEIAMLNALKTKNDNWQEKEMLKHMHRLEMASMRNADAANKPLTTKDLSDIRIKFSKDDRVKNIDALSNFNNELNDYLSSVTTADWKGQVSGEKRSELERKYNKLQTTMNRDYAKLGALAGQDLEILKGIFNDPTGFAGVYNMAMRGGLDSQSAAIKDYLGKSRVVADAELEVLKNTYEPQAVGNQLDLYSKRISGMGLNKTRGIPTEVSNKVKGNEKSPAEIEAEKILREQGLL